jgi:apolipoprotein N-acyltransferase
MPFNVLGYVLGNQIAIIQWYKFFGVLGGSLWILLCNFAFLRLFYCRKAKNILHLSVIIFFPITVSVFLYNIPEKTDTTVDISVLSLSDDVELCCGRTQMNEALDFITKEEISISSDIIVMPEGLCYLPATSFPYNFYFSLIKRYLKEKDSNASIIFGVRTQDISKETFHKDFFYNFAIQCDSSGFVNFRNKRSFTPFGEFIPYEKLFGKIPNIKEIVTLSLKSKPEYDTVFSLGGIKTLPLICYELYFGNNIAKYVRQYNPELIVVLSNDYSAKSKVFTNQFLRMARANAISVQKPVAKSALHGISFIVSHQGKVLIKSKFNSTEISQAKVVVNTCKTLFAYFGNVVVFVVWISLLIATLIFVRYGKK